MHIIPMNRTANLAETELVNDVHSQLNPTWIGQQIRPRNVIDLREEVQRIRLHRKQLSIAGGRHAMGGQQFLTAGVLLDMSCMNQILKLDQEQGTVEVQSGVLWPDLISYLRQEQKGRGFQWTIAQKQTGCDRLSIGGALAANVHGRGLQLSPIVANVQDFSLVTPEAEYIRCSRTSNAELFELAIGGYGLFGVITSVTLRLVPRTILRRTVEICEAGSVIQQMEERIACGATYGDFQFAIDDNSPDFLNKGILSTYAPVDMVPRLADNKQLLGGKMLSSNDWQELIYLAHVDKSAAFEKYCRHYLATDGQLYSSDVFQLATYIDDYHNRVNNRVSGSNYGTEMITELYVPRNMLGTFLNDAANLLREQKANVIYGTVRLIEKDTETFLPWATEPWACVVLNLHVEHSQNEIARNGKIFRDLIQLAIEHGGSYYLTYHKFATREQLLSCYPQFTQFLKLKAQYDQRTTLSSNWFEHVRKLVETDASV